VNSSFRSSAANLPIPLGEPGFAGKFTKAANPQQKLACKKRAKAFATAAAARQAAGAAAWP
jgi:hypothetical protein